MSFFDRKAKCEKYFNPLKKSFKSEGFKLDLNLLGKESKFSTGINFSLEGWESSSENQILTEKLLTLDISQYELCKQIHATNKKDPLYNKFVKQRNDCLVKILDLFEKKNSPTS